ncbi:ABC transporter permease [Lacinutrix sp. MEBiC02595]
MKSYLQLQFKMLNRRMIDFGLPLLIGYALPVFIFILCSNYLFQNTAFANYIYGLMALSLISRLSASKRNDFLKSIFNKTKYKLLRSLENSICCLPFTIYLLYQKQFIFSILLHALVIGMTLFQFNTSINITIPTPFGKNPFEFTVGFRKTFYVFPIAYLLTFITISVGNFNLGVFAMLLLGMVCFSYYSKMENEYFVWNFNVSPKEFLLKKIKTCFTYFTILSLPILIALSISFFNEIEILIIFFLLCYTYLATMILAKYSDFPNEINLSQGILMAMSFMFPPMLIVIIPYFYSQSIKKLNTVLND